MAFIISLIVSVLLFIGIVICFVLQAKVKTIVQSQEIGFWQTIISSLFGMALVFCLYIYSDSDRIKPIDVYRGKTILKIELNDGVQTDSMVIWKNTNKIEYQYK